MKDVKIYRRIGWHWAAFDTVRHTFPKFSSSAVAKTAIACANSGFGMSIFSSKKVKIMHCGFMVLLGWEDASALPMKVLTQLKALSNFPADNILKLIRFIQFHHFM